MSDDTFTSEEIIVARAMLARATPAPWKCDPTYNNGGMPLADFAIPGHNSGATVEMLAADAELIVMARSLLPRLLTRLEALPGEIEGLKQLWIRQVGDARVEVFKAEKALTAFRALMAEMSKVVQAAEKLAALRTVHNDREDRLIDAVDGYHKWLKENDLPVPDETVTP